MDRLKAESLTTGDVVDTRRFYAGPEMTTAMQSVGRIRAVEPKLKS